MPEKLTYGRAMIKRAYLFLFVAAAMLSGVGVPIGVSRAECVQNGLSVVCSGRDEDGFASAQSDLNILIVPGAIMRNFDPFDRLGQCPIALPSVATGDRATVTNQGFMFVRGVCGTGIQTGAQSTVINEDRIETLDILGFGIDVGPESTVINEGRLVTNQFVAYGVLAGDGSTIINRDGGLIRTRGTVASGINGGADITVMNDGTIQTDGDGAHAIDLNTGGLITNTGLIEVNAFQSAGIRIRSGAVTITNSGTIRGTYTGASALNAPEDGMLLDVSAVNISNSGSIEMSSASAASIRALMTGAGGVGISNTGSISAPSGGIAISGGGAVTVINDGTISATETGPALAIDGATGLVQVTNTGTLSAAGGVALRGSDSRDEVTNSGTLDGAVILGDGNDLLTLQTGAVIGGVLDGGTGIDELTLAGAGGIDFDVTGFEELVKLGQGTWSLARDATFTTRVRVLQDTLSIAAGGRLSTAQLDVFQGTTLALAGTLAAPFTNRGDFLITQGAVLDGDFTQTATGTLRLAALEPGVTSPVLSVSGSATLAGTLDIPLADQTPVRDGARVTVLTANAVTGAFTSTNVTAGAFLSAEAIYGGQSVDVLFSRTPYSTAAATENARALAGALDSALTSTPPDSAFPLFTALDALALEQASNTLAALANDAPLVLSAMDQLAVRTMTRTLMERTHADGVWGEVDQHWSEARNGAGQRLNRTATTKAAGVTMRLSDAFNFGVMLGQSDYRANTDMSSDRIEGQATHFGVSAGFNSGTWHAAAGAAVGLLDGASTRIAPLTSGGSNSGHADGDFYSAGLDLTQTLERGDIVVMFGGGAVMARLTRGAHDEIGGALDRLAFQTTSATTVRGHLSAEISAGFGGVQPELSTKISRELNGNRLQGRAALAVLPDNLFDLSLQAEKKTWIELAGRLPVSVTPDLEIALTGGGVINDRAGGHRIGISASWRW